MERRFAYSDEIESPLGAIAFAVDEVGLVLGAWCRGGKRPTALEAGLRRAGYTVRRDAARTAEARAQLLDYFAGNRRAFGLPVMERGTAFERAVWAETARIPFGETRTYGQIAASIGRPGKAIEVGAALAANPCLVVVPCHRVVGAGGALKGFAAGAELKARLLAFEASHVAVPAAAAFQQASLFGPSPSETSP